MARHGVLRVGIHHGSHTLDQGHQSTRGVDRVHQSRDTAWSRASSREQGHTQRHQRTERTADGQRRS